MAVDDIVIEFQMTNLCSDVIGYMESWDDLKYFNEWDILFVNRKRSDKRTLSGKFNSSTQRNYKSWQVIGSVLLHFTGAVFLSESGGTGLMTILAWAI